MSKCSRVKRPCKICLETVSRKNGLQCQGACESWVHYSCLNYTPGKIGDIKNGIIKVSCPCPDCKTIMPKEYRTDQPYSCSNQMCPANRPPKCANDRCPTNNSERRAVPPPTCPLGKCGTGCKPNSTPQLPYADVGPPEPTQPCVPLPQQCKPPRPTPSMSDGCLDPNRCSSGCSTATAMPKRDVPGDYGKTPVSAAPSLRAIENMCNTIGVLTNQLNDLMSKMQQMNTANQQGNADGTALRGYRPAKNQANIGSPPANCSCRVKTKKKLM